MKNPINSIKYRFNSKYKTIKTNRAMRKIADQCISDQGESKKILFGYCFSIDDLCRYHDFLLAQSLKSRGASIIPLICGAVQEVECSVYGGYWGNEGKSVSEKENIHHKNCKRCISCDMTLWKKWSNIQPLQACSFLTDEDKKSAKEYVDVLEVEKYKEWMYDDYFPIGKWSFREVCNSYLVSNIKAGSDEEKHLRERAYNEILMIVASTRCIEQVKPDIIYSNDSFYSPYCILEYIAKRIGMPFYNGYSFSKGTYSYAKDEPSMAMPVDRAWKTYRNRDLTNEENQRLDAYLKDREKGKNFYINTANATSDNNEFDADAAFKKLEKRKPTVLLAANVSWDGSSLDKCVAFDSIEEWLKRTALFFSEHNEWNIIIKAHPGEKHKMLPIAREQTGDIVKGILPNRVPDNIIILPGDAPVSVYSLFPYVTVGIAHTSTVACELAAIGIPVVLEGKAPIYGKGICYEPQNSLEYFDTISNLLNNPLDITERERIRELGRKFLYLYHFKYFIPINILTFDWNSGIELNIKDFDSIKRGANPIWDYVCDSIMEGEEVFDEDRYPPECVF